MPTTSNFGWTTPADTDLVKDGAAAIRTLGNGIDTSLVDLKGGTTGQVLSKASNTDLDFTWSSVDPLTILDAKGDLITATAADTPARLAVGANDTVLTADSTTATGLKWAAVAAGAYTQIATANLAGVSNYDFTSIPGTYKALYLRILDAYVAAGQKLYLTINNISATYSFTYMITNSASNVNLTAQAEFNVVGDISTSSASRTFADYNFPNYATADGFKVVYGWGLDTGAAATRQFVGINSNASARDNAITSIKIYTENNGNFTAGTATLFGVN